MIAALPYLLLGALVFLEQDIDGVRVTGVNPYGGGIETNFRQADLDGDGRTDLVLPTEVFLQRNGAFAHADEPSRQPDARATIPQADEHPYCDVWHTALYLRLEKALEVFRWENGGWQSVLNKPVLWPAPVPEDINRVETAGVRFQRFLHDVDGDGVPEIVLPGEDGLHVYRRELDKGLQPLVYNEDRDERGYSEAGRLDVFPPLRLARMPRQPLWPQEARRLVFPAREMSCRFFLEGNRLATLVREDIADKRVRYRVRRYTIDADKEYALASTGMSEEVTEPMSGDMKPCRLNNEDALAYAGGDWELSPATVLPVPIYETRVTLDGGKTIQAVRTRSFRPQCSFVDFDGDGRADMVTETTGLLSGGVRETVSRFLSGRDIEHEVHVHLQDVQGRFPKSPSLIAKFGIKLDEPPYKNSGYFRRYLAGELINVTGDFNGDKRRDIAVQDRPDRVAVYLNTGDTNGERGFSTSPDAVVKIDAESSFDVADVDGDGRSNVIVCLDDETGYHSRVWLAREGAP